MQAPSSTGSGGQPEGPDRAVQQKAARGGRCRYTAAMRRHGLYAITSAALCADEERLLGGVGAALDGGAVLIQYRDKASPPERRRRLAQRLRRLCADAGATFIVNDDSALAAEVGADGVHVGRSDDSLRLARARLGPRAIIGVSCQGSIERALAAVAEGADYVAFGRFFASTTKPDAPPADPAVLGEARARLRVPVCAIGGVTPANLGRLVMAGADLVAAVEGVFGATDIRAAARAYTEACDRARTEAIAAAPCRNAGLQSPS